MESLDQSSPRRHDEEDPPDRWYHFGVMLWALLMGAVFVVMAVEDPVGPEEVLSEVGVLAMIMALMCSWVIIRRIVWIFVVGISRRRAKELDLWKGERVFVVSAALVILGALVAHRS